MFFQLQCHCGCFADDKFGTEFELSLNITVPDRIENIQMALNNYFEKVRVKRYCSFCKKYNFSDKWLLLTEPPLVAIIHLKRFGNNEWKIAKPVSFSMELDLKPYSTGSDNVSLEFILHFHTFFFFKFLAYSFLNFVYITYIYIAEK